VTLGLCTGADIIKGQTHVNPWWAALAVWGVVNAVNVLQSAGFLTLLVFLGVIGSALAMRATLREWENLPISQAERSLMPSLHSRGLALSLGRVASWGICIMLLLAWGVLFGPAVVLV
jgi:hypothetical protein